MTWELTTTLARHNLTLKEGMNLLQNNAIISDNSIAFEDVGTADSAAAVKWLDEHFKET